MKIGRNDPCPCGSGKKYKKCCEAKDEAARSADLAEQAAAAAKAAADSKVSSKEAAGAAQRPNVETASRPKFPAPPAPPPPIRRRAV